MDLVTKLLLMENRTAVGFAKTLQMLQYRHKEVFTTSYNFDFKSRRSIYRLENTRKKMSLKC